MGSNEVCSRCDGSGLIAPPGLEEPIDCPDCDGDGFVIVDDEDQ
jgi:DnaJ-class molecular chaperone